MLARGTIDDAGRSSAEAGHTGIAGIAGIERGMPLVVALVAVGAIVAGLAAVVALRRRPEAVVALRQRPLLTAGALVLASAPVLPAWAVAAYTADVDAVIERTIDTPGVEVVALDRTWLRIDPGTELASLRVRPANERAAGGGSAAARSNVAAALIDAGFEEVDGSYYRENGGGGLGWRDTDRVSFSTDTDTDADGEAGEAGEVTLDLRLPNAHAGELVPPAVLVSSVLVALAALALGATPAGRWVGAAGLALTAAQGVLAVRALLRATALIDDHRSAVGPLTRDDLWVSPQSPALRALRSGVEDAAGYLYPLGAGALVLLAIPWLLASAAVVPRRPRAIVGINLAWAVVAVAALLAFRSESGIVLDILE